MKDKNGTQMIDATTSIGGRSHEQLRRAFEKCLQQIQQEQDRSQRAAVDALKREINQERKSHG